MSEAVGLQAFSPLAISLAPFARMSQANCVQPDLCVKGRTSPWVASEARPYPSSFLERASALDTITPDAAPFGGHDDWDVKWIPNGTAPR